MSIPSESAAASAALPLDSTQVRILGSLIEKQATSPETYPLTLNALMIACNQKTSREPVMNLTQGQVGQSLRALEGRGFTKLVMGSRADRWEHRVDKALELVPAQVVLAGLLFLRGPQTVNELLTRSGRMHDFEDAEQVVHQCQPLVNHGDEAVRTTPPCVAIRDLLEQVWLLVEGLASYLDVHREISPYVKRRVDVDQLQATCILDLLP